MRFIVYFTAGLFLCAPLHADFIGNLIDTISPKTSSPTMPATNAKGQPSPELIDRGPQETPLKRPAHIRILDKRTNRLENATLTTTAPKQFDTLTIQVKNCIRHHNQVGHHAAWFTITDNSENDKAPQIHPNQQNPEPLPLFDGWMLSAFPAVAALEHPRYDVRIIECKR